MGMRCDIVKKSVYLIITLFGLLIGAVGAFVSIKLALAAAACLVMLLIILIDFETVTYITALYVFIDYVFRNYIGSATIAGHWDELLIILCIGMWFYKWFVYRKEKPYKWTPIEYPLLFFIGISLFLLLFNSTNMQIGIEGFRAVVEYMLWFFVIMQLLRTPTGAKRILYLLVLVGTILGLHGIYQYVTHVPVPLTWIDRAEMGVSSRAFAIMGNPNALASLQVLFIPVSVSLVFYERKLIKKIIFSITALIMTACLVFTLTRSAWIAFALALMIFVFSLNKKLFIPFTIVFIVAASAVAIFIPSVRNRIVYLISPEYFISSSKGGRIFRWKKGLKLLLEDNPWLGVGFGRFGGAVAANNKMPGTIYMDNYYIKCVVETGFIGLSAFLLLIYNVIIWSIRTILNLGKSRYGYLAKGIFAGLCGVLFHAFAENVFEVPAVTVYFWIMTAIMMFFWNSERQGLFGTKE